MQYHHHYQGAYLIVVVKIFETCVTCEGRLYVVVLSEASVNMKWRRELRLLSTCWEQSLWYSSMNVTASFSLPCCTTTMQGLKTITNICDDSLTV